MIFFSQKYTTAIESVLNQDYENLEYILVDPGSTDGSRDIINEYKNRISTIIFQPDSGPAEGLNNGFLKATGEIFGYLNADDILLSGTCDRVFQPCLHGHVCYAEYPGLTGTGP